VPKVSVVIPTFGRAELLRRALRSVLAQTETDIEVIVVVDGDDPPTIAVLQGEPDPRLKYIVQPVKGGAAHARDMGVDASQSDWVAFLDDDDEWLPRKLELQLAAAPAQPAMISVLSQVGVGGSVRIKPQYPYDGVMPFDEWLFDRLSWFESGGFVQSSSLMVPRALFTQLRFSDTRLHDDWEFVIRAVKAVHLKFVTVREPLVFHFFDQKRSSLQATLTWRHSLEWSQRMAPILTPRALSGFLLTIAARVAANAGDYSAISPLLSYAFKHGSPTARQLFAFVLLWALPLGMRKRLRYRLAGK